MLTCKKYVCFLKSKRLKGHLLVCNFCIPSESRVNCTFFPSSILSNEVNVPFEGPINQIMLLQQFLMMEEGDSSILDIPWFFYSDRYSLANITDYILDHYILDQPRRRHQVQIGKKPICLKKYTPRLRRII